MTSTWPGLERVDVVLDISGAYWPRVKEAIVGRQGRAVAREHVPGHARAGLDALA